MTQDRLEHLRNLINTMIVSDDFDQNELVEKSQELDKLIVQSMRENYKEETESCIDFNAILKNAGLFSKMYDSMRLVDPVAKEVLEFQRGKLNNSDSECYKVWERYKFCENCVAIRAYNKDDTVFKLEYCEKDIFMITAVPITIQGRKLIAEFLKEVTNSLCIQDQGYEYEISLHSSIKNMNHKAVKDKLTDIYSRDYISERLPAEVYRSSLKNEPLSIIMI